MAPSLRNYVLDELKQLPFHTEILYLFTFPSRLNIGLSGIVKKTYVFSTNLNCFVVPLINKRLQGH